MNLQESVQFILKHFEGHQQLFPRYIMVGKECKRILVYNIKEIIDACDAANLIDCRIMAYPIYPGKLKEISPCEVLIDLDFDYKSKPYPQALKQANRVRNKTIKRIRELFQASKDYSPTILETGNGYHIYLVLETRPLEYNEKLKAVGDNPSQKFLKWIAKKCSKEIYFDPDYISKSGKSIPLSKSTGEPHNCDDDNELEQKQ